ncbi:Aste57867_12088 [Aphanomyces stellatus]|uniref:Aste57867_12088 protein n=1 Tax=Aphanomyces stellatus TaxID=120398 RepID=A0A485KUP1_9STRA|nr:hypothetical protein As57867_012043 [Aphanomyces stellatus]VFT88943.1 Aste57867_12088 [Aphanomyces stellatus]
MGDDLTQHDATIRIRLMNVRNLEAMHAMEDEITRLQTRLREVEAREKNQHTSGSHFSFVLQRNQELELIAVSSFKETETMRDELERLRLKLHAATAARDQLAETNHLQDEECCMRLLQRDDTISTLRGLLAALQAEHRVVVKAMATLRGENESIAQAKAVGQAQEATWAKQRHDMDASMLTLRGELSKAESNLAHLRQEKEIKTQSLLAQLEKTLESQQEQILKVEEKSPDCPRPCPVCGDMQVTKEKHKRQLDNVARQRDKLIAQLDEERVRLDVIKSDGTQEAGNFARDGMAAKTEELVSLRAQLAMANQVIEKQRRFMKEAENSTSFERYVNLKTENLMLTQQLEQVKSPVKSPRADMNGSETPDLKRRLSKPKNVVMPLIGSANNQRSSSWFKLNC